MPSNLSIIWMDEADSRSVSKMLRAWPILGTDVL